MLKNEIQDYTYTYKRAYPPKTITHAAIDANLQRQRRLEKLTAKSGKTTEKKKSEATLFSTLPLTALLKVDYTREHILIYGAFK